MTNEEILLKNLTNDLVFKPLGFKEKKNRNNTIKRERYSTGISDNSLSGKIIDFIFYPKQYFDMLKGIGIILLSILIYLFTGQKVISIILFIIGLFIVVINYL